jgi:LysM repeat protein
MRRHRMLRQISPFWLIFISVAAGAGMLAWRFGWLPIEIGNTETGRVDETVENSDQVPGSQFAEADNSKPVEEFYGNEQAEPSAYGISSNSQVNAIGQSSNDTIPPPWLPPSSVDSARESRITQAIADPRILQASNQEEPPFRENIQQASAETTPETFNEGRAKVSGALVTAKASPRPASTKLTVDQELKRIDELLDRHQDVAAHRELSKIYWNQADLRPVIHERIEATAKRIYFSSQPHYMTPYKIQYGDRLSEVAKRYKVTWQYLAKLNQVDPGRIREGQTLKVIKGPFSAYIDLSDFELTIHAGGYFVKRYRIGIGKAGSSPIGKFKVDKKVTNPQYTDPQGRVLKGDDPRNPVGEYWISIGNSFGIHGTINPSSIGQAVSAGCIRLNKADIAEVYDFLDLGSEVIIRR